VCTTELGYMAGLKPEFDKRNTKIIGLSVDPVSDHENGRRTSRTSRATPSPIR
jgi:alkyl hydroperoxide reductase subunit AhpC